MSEQPYKPTYITGMLMTTLSVVMFVANQKVLSFYHLPAGIIPGILLIGLSVFSFCRLGFAVYSRIFIGLMLSYIIIFGIFHFAISLPADENYPYAALYNFILTISPHQLLLNCLCLACIYMLGSLLGSIFPKLKTVNASNIPYRYFTLIGSTFVLVLLISNITTQKVVHVWDIVVDVGTFYFPITYIFNNIFTEVYGYAASRKLIWMGLACNIIMITLLELTVLLPSAHGWHHERAYNIIAGNVPRIVLGSISAFFCGEFLNSYVLAKLKVLTKGKMLWTRTIGSTVFGNAADSIIFNILAFAGIIPLSTLWQVALWQYGLKVGFEVIATPVTYLIVLMLKRKENKDHFDYHTNFNPFALEE